MKRWATLLFFLVLFLAIANPTAAKIVPSPSPADLSEALSVMLSYQRLYMLQKYGPYGEDSQEHRDHYRQLFDHLPEMSKLYSNDGEIEPITPRNFLLKLDPPLSFPAQTTVHNLANTWNIQEVHRILAQMLLDESNDYASFTSMIRQEEDTNAKLHAEEFPDNKPTHPRESAIQQAMLQQFKHQLTSVASISFHVSGPDIPAFIEQLKALPSTIGLPYALLAINSYNVFETVDEGLGGDTPFPTVIVHISPDYLFLHNSHMHRASDSSLGMWLLFCIAIIIAFQVMFSFWQHSAPNSYNLFLVVCLAFVPLIVAIVDSFKRFVICWWVYMSATVLTFALIFCNVNYIAYNIFKALDLLDIIIDVENTTTSEQAPAHERQHLLASNSPPLPPSDEHNHFTRAPLTQPNMASRHQAQSTSSPEIPIIISPRYVYSLVYKYLLFAHKVLLGLFFVAVITFILDVFGFWQQIGLVPSFDAVQQLDHPESDEPLTMVLFSIYLAFYSIYFGVLNRDIASILLPYCVGLSRRFRIIDQYEQARRQEDFADAIVSAKTAAVSTQQQIGGSSGPQNIHSSPSADNDEDIFDDANDNLSSSDSKPSLVHQVVNRVSFLLRDDNPSIRSTAATAAAATTTTAASSTAPLAHTFCGICREVFPKYQSPHTTSPLHPNGGGPSQPPAGLTISTIRQRLRERTVTGGLSTTQFDGSMQCQTQMIGCLTWAGTAQRAFAAMLLRSALAFIALVDFFMGGTGDINLDNVVVSQGVFHVKSSTISRSSTSNPHEQHSEADLEGGEGFTAGRSQLGTHGFLAEQIDENDNVQTSTGDAMFCLPCGCYCHELCLRGYLLLGKQNSCPICKQLCPVGDIFITPWNAVYGNYQHFLDMVKYCIAINPLIFWIISLVLKYAAP